MFDFLIPALKKRDGKNNMFPIAFKEASSGLFERRVNVSKEAIRLKTRVPVNSGNTGWDTTFEGVCLQFCPVPRFECEEGSVCVWKASG